jgi:hypothetical protein
MGLLEKARVAFVIVLALDSPAAVDYDYDDDDDRQRGLFKQPLRDSFA